MSDDEERVKVLDRIGEAFKDLPAEELEREVNDALAAVRAKRRAAKPAARPSDPVSAREGCRQPQGVQPFAVTQLPQHELE